MPKSISPAISQFIAEAAFARANELPLSSRADLYDAVSTMLDKKAATEAQLIAFNLREIERHQLQLDSLFKTVK